MSHAMPSFNSLEEEVAFLRAWTRVSSLVDTILEDCLEQRMGLQAGLDVFLSQCVRLVGAQAGFARIEGSSGPVLALVEGALDLPFDEACSRCGVRELPGRTLFVKELALGRTRLGVFGLLVEKASQPDQVMALVDAMGEQLDSALLGFLALAEGRSAPQRLDELALTEGFQPRARVARFELLLPLGAGGMGQVFVARQEAPDGIGRLVALKRVLPHLRDDAEASARFLDEGRIGLRLHHPNLVTVYDFGRAPGGDYLAMELVRGVTLRELLAQGGPLSASAAVAIASQALSGLHAAHELRGEDGEPLRLVHRDLSPRNVMAGFDGYVKVLDFGVAKSAGQSVFTAANEVRGKLRYLSPEQAVKADLDRRSDLFSMATVTYEALTGALPFEGDTAVLMLRSIHDSPPRADPRIPPALWNVLQACFSKRAEQRPATALEMAQMLTGAVRPLEPAALGALVLRTVPKAAEATGRWGKMGGERTR
ncbi:MAG TPA: serine/threonine-protein kinase [Myxococcales bacterium]|jgi:serine/threonine-protein kinase